MTHVTDLVTKWREQEAAHRELLYLTLADTYALHARELSEAIKLDDDETRDILPDEDTISDGFGNYWSVICPECKRRSMEIVRPGKVQCGYCG